MERYQMEANSLKMVRVTLLIFIGQQIVTGREEIYRELHVCYNTGYEIILNCTSSEMIQVESAVVGTSKGWASGTINCPRNNENCVQGIAQPFEECNRKSTCSLPQTIINSDIGNGCGPTNFINIIYICLPMEPAITVTAVNTIDETSSTSAALSVEPTITAAIADTILTRLTSARQDTSTSDHSSPSPDSVTDWTTNSFDDAASCSSGCIAGIIVAFAVVIGLVAFIVYMYRRKMKERPKKGSPFDVVNPDGTEIIDNTTYSTVTDNHSDRIINTNKNTMLPGPVIVSNPDYWDGDINASESVKPKANHDYLDIVGTLPSKPSNNDKLQNYEEVNEATFEANTGKNLSRVSHMKGPDGDYYALPDKGTGALAGEAGMSDGTTNPSNGVVHVKGPAGDYYALPANESGIAGVGDPYSLAGDPYVYPGEGVGMNDGDTELVDNAMYGTQ